MDKFFGFDVLKRSVNFYTDNERKKDDCDFFCSISKANCIDFFDEIALEIHFRNKPYSARKKLDDCRMEYENSEMELALNILGHCYQESSFARQFLGQKRSVTKQNILYGSTYNFQRHNLESIELWSILPELNALEYFFNKPDLFFAMSNEKYSILRPCLLYTSPSPRDKRQSRMPSSA